MPTQIFIILYIGTRMTISYLSIKCNVFSCIDCGEQLGVFFGAPDEYGQ